MHAWAGHHFSLLVVPYSRAHHTDPLAGLFDSHALFTDMYANPGAYLNGTAPLNVTGSAYTCVYKEWTDVRDKPLCTKVNGTDRDSYLW